jgi:proline racemase/trans-L-3-hydroxyproline dehydratase
VLAVLDAMGVLEPGRPVVHEGLSGLTFTATVAARTEYAGLPAIVADVSGEAWRTGEHVFFLAPDDPSVETRESGVGS